MMQSLLKLFQVQAFSWKEPVFRKTHIYCFYKKALQSAFPMHPNTKHFLAFLYYQIKFNKTTHLIELIQKVEF